MPQGPDSVSCYIMVWLFQSGFGEPVQLVIWSLGLRVNSMVIGVRRRFAQFALYFAALLCMSEWVPGLQGSPGPDRWQARGTPPLKCGYPCCCVQPAACQSACPCTVPQCVCLGGGGGMQGEHNTVRLQEEAAVRQGIVAQLPAAGQRCCKAAHRRSATGQGRFRGGSAQRAPTAGTPQAHRRHSARK